MTRWAIITFANTTCLPHRNRAAKLPCHHEGQTLIHLSSLTLNRSYCVASCTACAEQKSFGAFYLLFHANRTRPKLTPAPPNAFVYRQPLSIGTMHCARSTAKRTFQFSYLCLSFVSAMFR